MIRISVLGAANIATRSIIPVLTEEDGFLLVGIGYREHSFDKARKCSEQFGCKPIPLENIFEGIDAIYIPYPPSLHKEWILKAINLGIHVWCEKPLCTNVNDLNEIEALAKEKNVVILENYMFLRHRQHKVARNLLNQIGQLQVFKAAFCFPPFPNKHDIRYHEQLGGGALLDCSGYPIQASIYFLGQNLTVESSSLTQQKSVDGGLIDIAGDITLRSESGVPAHIYFGFNHEYQCMYEIIGTKGIIRVPKAYTPRADKETLVEVLQQGNTTTHRIPAEDHFYTTAQEFRNLIENKQALCTNWDATVSCIRIQEDIRLCALKVQSM